MKKEFTVEYKVCITIKNSENDCYYMDSTSKFIMESSNNTQLLNLLIPEINKTLDKDCFPVTNQDITIKRFYITDIF